MVMQTDDIQCENSKDGYNSSIILWRKNIGREIYDYMARYDKWINKQVIRFDHYLEFIVKDADFIQEVYKGKVLDYNTYCKDKEVLPEMGAIVAFPRNPKPHECSEKWISQFWN